MPTTIRLGYCLWKCFELKYLFRGEQIKAEHSSDNIDLILTKQGLFTIKKYIGVGVVKKYHIEVEKQFAITQVGEG